MGAYLSFMSLSCKVKETEKCAPRGERLMNVGKKELIKKSVQMENCWQD